MSYLRILRPSVCILAILAVVIGAVISGVPLSIQILIAAIVAFLIAGAGNAINDYFDYKADMINKPRRPIPAGKIRRDDVLIYSIILFIIALSLVMTLNVYCIILAFFNAFIVIVYSLGLKRLPLIGNFGPSWLAASSFLFGGLLAGSIPLILIYFVIMAFFGNMGREIAKSIEDMRGDKRVGTRTLPIVTGIKNSAFIAFAFVSIAVLISLIPYFLNLMNVYYLLIVIIADIIFLVSSYVLLRSATESQTLMKTGMFTAILAFIVGVL